MGRPPTHGMTGTPTHQSWTAMRGRCSRPNARRKYYFDRGITVCKRWGKFEHFFSDMGERPEGTSLERKDSSKGYSPENCIWATPKQQALNRPHTVMVTFRGLSMCKSDWARKLGIRPYALNLRIRKWGLERALTTERGVTGPKTRMKW